MQKIKAGSLYVKTMPRCPVHGKMRMGNVPPPRVLWTCAGFDGEGCDYEVDGNDIPWEHIGYADRIEFTAPAREDGSIIRTPDGKREAWAWKAAAKTWERAT